MQARQELGHFKNALIHQAGPLFSILYALVAIGIHLVWQPDSTHLLRLASFSAQVGLFNLLPLGNMSDGGKIVRRALASLDEKGDRELTVIPIHLLLCLPLGYTIVAMLEQGWDKLVTSAGTAGMVVLAVSMVLLWLAHQE